MDPDVSSRMHTLLSKMTPNSRRLPAPGWVGAEAREERGWFFPLQLSNTPHPPPDRLWRSDVNPPGDSLCGVARMVTVQRQSRSVAWALGGQGFRYDFAGDYLIITSLGLSFLTPNVR